ncbi:hypothetical protein [Halarcobacter ebronensis]|uniref:Uncharacterized protein n=1 Tax=Halarcobacter ebronensis TaxID=1462615 RepID=A0A4Q1AVI0_9BACT|nr:hypothetical protein [Halarcobacter ebronensis]QKF82056.1 hypothetical protein AEBR_1573 [Halarcobacter ebronensis]RXK04111.1 hypothetical protein CRV07_11840 [Halarcobacter ebronensis]
MLRTISLAQEHSNLKINPCNYLHGLSVPSSVKVYVTLNEEHDLDNAFPLKNNSILRWKKNGIYQPPTQLYIHTIGTSTSKLEIQTDVIDYNNNEYMEIEQQDNQTMNLTEEVTNSLLSQNVKSFDTSLLAQLDKIIQPYDYDNATILHGISNSNVTLLDTIANCDLLRFSLQAPTSSSGEANGKINLYIDDIPYTTAYGTITSGRSSTTPNTLGEYIGIRGKRIKIVNSSLSTTNTSAYYLQLINKKV